MQEVQDQNSDIHFDTSATFSSNNTSKERYILLLMIQKKLRVLTYSLTFHLARLKIMIHVDSLHRLTNYMSAHLLRDSGTLPKSAEIDYPEWSAHF